LAHADQHGWPRYVAHQAYYSLLAREYEWELMPLALDQRVATIVWSPLSGGRLSGKVGRNRSAPAGSRTATMHGSEPLIPEEQFYAIVDVLEAIAAELGRSVSQVALNWLLLRPTVATLVIGARNEGQLRENLRTVEFSLSSEQVQRLDKASARPLTYPYWHQQAVFAERNPPPKFGSIP
jgi:aryl-alcohol dehydrogenase-like predicted oxidoreductase